MSAKITSVKHILFPHERCPVPVVRQSDEARRGAVHHASTNAVMSLEDTCLPESHGWRSFHNAIIIVTVVAIDRLAPLASGKNRSHLDRARSRSRRM